MIDVKPPQRSAMPQRSTMSQGSVMGIIQGSALLLVATLLLGACATSTMVERRGGSPAAGIYGISAGRLVMIGSAPSAEGTAPIDDAGALTYDPLTQTFYAVAGASSKPRLLAIDPTTGEARTVGPIEEPKLDLTLVEGLAFNPDDNTLYAAGGESTFASNVLLTVDPASGEARQVARIHGTIQDEVDAMTFADGSLYAVDGAGNAGALYRIDPETGQASRLGKPFAQTVVDLAFDPAGNRLYGARGKEGSLVVISIFGDSVGEIPATGGVLNALAIIPSSDGASLFRDGFETGNTSAWSRSPEQKQR